MKLFIDSYRGSHSSLSYSWRSTCDVNAFETSTSQLSRKTKLMPGSNVSSLAWRPTETLSLIQVTQATSQTVVFVRVTTSESCPWTMVCSAFSLDDRGGPNRSLLSCNSHEIKKTRSKEVWIALCRRRSLSQEGGLALVELWTEALAHFWARCVLGGGSRMTVIPGGWRLCRAAVSRSLEVADPKIGSLVAS